MSAPGRREIPLERLRVGMRLANPVYAPGGGAALLAAGRTVTDAHLGILRRAGIESVMIAEEPPSASALAAERSLVSRRVGVRELRAAAEQGRGVSTAARLDPGVLSALESAGVGEIEVLLDPDIEVGAMSLDAAKPQAGRILAEVLRANRRTRDPAARALHPEQGLRAAAALDAAIDAVAWSGPTAELLLTFGLRPGFLGPAVETALMSAVVGAVLGWDDARLAEMAICGLLADVGMLRLPERIVHKPGYLSEAERRIVQQHPELGATLLDPLTPMLAPRAPEVALQHHERVDGTGYPRGLGGDRIMCEAQIVSLCHLLLAGLTGTAYRRALSPHRALDLVERSAGSACDPEIVRAFLSGVAVHPVGSIVRLSSGECGRVLPGGTPRRPRIEVLWAADGADAVPRVVVAAADGDGLHVTAVAA